MRSPMRLAFMGTPDFAVPALDALVDAGHEVVAAYCQPPRPGNRGRLQPSPVQLRAEALGIEVRTPANFRAEEDRAAFAALSLDAAVVAAYGLILPVAILEAPRFGCFNIHASLLPRWRGAAPIQRAIMAGDTVTGVTIMQMERGLDTGPMLLAEATPIDGKTTGALTQELGVLGARLMVDALDHLSAIQAVPQPAEGVTYASKIDKAEARIDWREPAEQVLRRIHAMSPAPGPWFLCGQERVKVVSAALGTGAGATGTIVGDVVICGTGGLRLLEVQPAGGKPMPFDAFARGRQLPERLD